MREKLSIVLAGVGGQGVLTAASILGKAAVKAGVNVLVSEVHGMAQRGGVVKCTVRMGNVHSALIARGTADVIVSTEPVEALRHIDKVNKDSIVITDINPVIPPSVIFDKIEYPDVDAVLNEIKKHCKLYSLDATELAKRAGDMIAKNIVLLGALSGLDILPFSHEILLETIVDTLPEAYKDINVKAFNFGREEIISKRDR